MSQNLLNVLIVGCGNIAGRFDEHCKSADFPLTHAGGFSRDERFNIVACVDPDTARRNEFMNTWDVYNGFHSIDDIPIKTGQFDVISICSPTSNHGYDLEVALKFRPKLVFCEKPVTSHLTETEELINQYENLDIPVAVNYTRRWDPDVQKLFSEINDGHWGKLRSVTGVYNKGLLNNGSHMLDLLGMLFGQLTIKQVGNPVVDFFDDDPSIPVWLEGNSGVPIYLSCGHAADYSIFELQFIFTNGVLSMEDGGMHWRERRTLESKTFNGYRVLNQGEYRPGRYRECMLQAIDNIYCAITQGKSLKSNGESAVAVQRLCEGIKHIACN